MTNAKRPPSAKEIAGSWRALIGWSETVAFSGLAGQPLTSLKMSTANVCNPSFP